MKKLSIAAFVVTVLAIITVQYMDTTSATNNSLFACVQCKVVENCRVCVGGGDANTCMTAEPQCEACIEMGICPPGSGFADGKSGESCTVSEKSFDPNKKIRISREIISEIAQAHPRFAASLENINKFGFGAGPYRVKWTPTELSADDVRLIINPDYDNKKYYSDRLAKAMTKNQQIRQGLEKEIVYLITIEEINDFTKMIRLQTESGSISENRYSSLEIIVKSNAGNVSNLSRSNFEWAIQ